MIDNRRDETAVGAGAGSRSVSSEARKLVAAQVGPLGPG